MNGVDCIQSTNEVCFDNSHKIRVKRKKNKKQLLFNKKVELRVSDDTKNYEDRRQTR